MAIRAPLLVYPQSGSEFSYTTSLNLWAENRGLVSDTGNLFISGCGTTNCYIRCWCSRWDETNYRLILETFLTETERDNLYSSTVPGAVRELYNILGKPYYIDTTYTSGNTLKITPTGNLSNLYDERLIAVKSISDSPLKGPSGYIHVKIEGVRLDI